MEREMGSVLNLTPHVVKVGRHLYPPVDRAHPARAFAPEEPNPRPDKTAEMGVPVVDPYDYTEFIGLPRPELKKPGHAVIVSQIAADWLKALGPQAAERYLGRGTSLYVPDTDRGAIRTEGGVLEGTTRLIFQLETST